MSWTMPEALMGAKLVFRNRAPDVDATFQSGDVATIFAGLDPVFAPADTAVIIDPPRKGCDESFLAQPFDLFPQPRHLACVITLHRGAPLTSVS